MERLEIIVKLYSIENRLQNVNLSSYDKQQAKLKFNKLLGELFRHKIEYKKRDKISSPEKLISYFIKKYDFPKDFTENKTRNAYYVECRNIVVVFIKHIFRELNLTQVMGFINKDHSKYYNSEKSIKDKYDTDLEFRNKFNRMQKNILGVIKIF